MLTNRPNLRYYFLIVILSSCTSFLYSQNEVNLNNSPGSTDSLDKLNENTVRPGFLSSDNKTTFGTEGMGLSTRIVGTPILNISGSPLLVVNGIPYYNLSAKDFDFETADEREYANLIGISQEDIKEISILRDAVSIAQYGINGANGVILITTHQGSKDKIHVNYSYKNTQSNRSKGYDLLNGSSYRVLMIEEFENLNIILNRDYYPQIFADDPDNPYYYYNYNQNTDWQNAITQKGLTKEHNLSISGGKNKFGVRFSIGSLAQNGTTIGTCQDRITSRLSLDYSFSDRLKLSVDLDYLHSKVDSNYQKSGYLPIQELAVKKMPNMSVYEFNELGEKSSIYFAPKNNLQGIQYVNPVALVNLSRNENKTERIIPSITINYKPLKQLSYILNVMTNSFSSRFIYADYLAFPYEVSSTESEYNQFFTRNQLVYTPVINSNHSLKALALFSTNSIMYQPQNKKYKNYFSVLQLNYLAFNKYGIDISGKGQKKYVGETKLDFMLDPALTIQWFAKNENLLKNITLLDNLSFTASCGRNSNPQYLGIFAPKITEISLQQDAGFNIVMLKNRIDLNFMVYKKTFKDQIVEPVVYFFNIDGQFTITDNSVPHWDVEYTGWEFTMNTTVIKSKDLAVDFFISLNRNLKTISKVSSTIQTQTGYGLQNGSYIHIMEMNKPIGSFYGYQCEGVFINNDDAIAQLRNGTKLYDIDGNPQYKSFNSNYTFEGGDVKYSDLNYDGIINEYDIKTIGDVNPLFTGSGGTTFRYKGWFLGIYFNFRYGNDIVNMAQMSLENMYSFDNQSTVVINRWRKEGDIKDIPRALHSYGYNWLGSTRFVEDGSFLRLKAITLKHEFAGKLVKKLHLSSLSCYVTARNIFTYTNYKGADPDISLYGTSWDEMGYDYNYMAIAKEITFGLNVGI